VSGLSASLAYLALGLVVLFVLAATASIIYLAVKYTPKIVRIFEDRPVFLPLRIHPRDDGESVGFPADDGVRLSGTYLHARTTERIGVLVYCHEFLSDRWSYQPYLDELRDAGYDIFTFDFRNHGESEAQPDYQPLQWVSNRELADLSGALKYLRSRADRDPAGFGLFGVSRGGTTALFAAADEPDVWGVITDGAFPTRGTMIHYIIRWAEIYVRSRTYLALIPRWVYEILAWIARRGSELRQGCRFMNVESAVARLAPRPWLMIHGERDTYIGPEIARALFDYGDGPREMWLVPDAKHNRCRDRDPQAYAARVKAFLAAYAPRRQLGVLPAAPSNADLAVPIEPAVPAATPTPAAG